MISLFTSRNKAVMDYCLFPSKGFEFFNGYDEFIKLYLTGGIQRPDNPEKMDE